jgi:WD40 repeat protein
MESDWNACLQTPEGHSNAVWSVAFSPDDQQLASASDDGTVKIWNAVTGQCLRTLEGRSPDGQHLASASDDRTVKIWNTVTGQWLRTLEGHRRGVLSVAFSFDGQRLASASGDGTVTI